MTATVSHEEIPTMTIPTAHYDEIRAALPADGSHLERLVAARKLTGHDAGAAYVLDPSGTHRDVILDPYFRMGPRRPTAREVVRIMADRGHAIRPGARLTYAGTTVCVQARRSTRYRRLDSITFSVPRTGAVSSMNLRASRR